jgi:hypothetical protein
MGIVIDVLQEGLTYRFKRELRVLSATNLARRDFRHALYILTEHYQSAGLDIVHLLEALLDWNEEDD